MIKEHSTEKALKNTLKHMVPAVGTAVIASILGFTALYISPVPMVQDFGKMLTFGVIISLAASIFLLIPLLFIRDRFFPRESKRRQKRNNGPFEQAMAVLTTGTLRLGPLILIVALLLTSLGAVADTKVGVQTDVEKFMPQNTSELHDIHSLRDALGATDQIVILYEVEDTLDGEIMNWVEKKTDQLPELFPEQIVNAKSIASVLKTMNQGTLPDTKDIPTQVGNIPDSQLKLLMTDDRRRGIIQLDVKHLESEEMKDFIGQLQKNIDSDTVPGVKPIVTGKSVLDTEMITALTTGRYEMTLFGIGLVFLVLLLLYRHPVKAFVAILPIGLIIGWSGGLMYALGFGYTPLTATLGALVIGIGTEFTILIMERFYEERRKGIGRKDAITVATQKIGKAILASGLTVIGGFSALIASDFVILSNFGVMTVINMALCLISTLIVLPPTLVLLDRFVRTKTVAS